MHSRIRSSITYLCGETRLSLKNKYFENNDIEIRGN